VPELEITARSRLEAPAELVSERTSTRAELGLAFGCWALLLGAQRLWEDERRMEPEGDRCVLIDRICHEPRLAFGERAQSAALRQLLLHRHRRLRRRFGGGPDRRRR
jgi:hypothetical protein